MVILAAASGGTSRGVSAEHLLLIGALLLIVEIPTIWKAFTKHRETMARIRYCGCRSCEECGHRKCAAPGSERPGD